MSPRPRRLDSRIPLSVWLEYDGFERFHPEKTLNVSRSGAFVLSQRPLGIGRRVAFRFSLPDLPGDLLASGVVVWVPSHESSGAAARHPRGMGVQFDDTNPELQRTLDQYITVNSGLRQLDPRIGKELPVHLRMEIRAADTTPIQIALGDFQDISIPGE